MEASEWFATNHSAAVRGAGRELVAVPAKTLALMAGLQHELAVLAEFEDLRILRAIAAEPDIALDCPICKTGMRLVQVTPIIFSPDLD